MIAIRWELYRRLFWSFLDDLARLPMVRLAAGLAALALLALLIHLLSRPRS